MSIEYTDEDLKKVNQLWKEYKARTGGTQLSAAKAMGLNQSALSQYLRGKDAGGIALNTNFLLRFCKLVGGDVEEFGVPSEAGHSGVEVKYTVSGKPPVIPWVSAIVKSKEAYGVLMDVPGLILGTDAVLVVEPGAEICNGSLVVFSTAGEDVPQVAVMAFSKSSWWLQVPSSFGFKSLPSKEAQSISPVTSIITQSESSKVFRKSTL